MPKSSCVGFVAANTIALAPGVCTAIESNARDSRPGFQRVLYSKSRQRGDLGYRRQRVRLRRHVETLHTPSFPHRLNFLPAHRDHIPTVCLYSGRRHRTSGYRLPGDEFYAGGYPARSDECED